jgi:hypothetical protein
MEDDSEDESPIQELIDALKEGRAQLKRISGMTGTSARAYPNGTLDAVHSLDTILHRTEAKITNIYMQNVREFGKPFINALTAVSKSTATSLVGDYCNRE